MIRRAEDDYGLLVAAATVFDDDSARAVRQALQSNGIRATAGPVRRSSHTDTRLRVLVFPEDAWRAYRVLCRITI